MILIFVLFITISVTSGKTYQRCELARELKYIHEAPDHQLATWVCIAEHESQYNTSAVGHLNADGSGDHGIFQISDLYWCSPPGKGWACGVTCAQLEDDDIEDDFICAKRIYREHKRLQGDGFRAWVAYNQHCQGSQVERYIHGCFDEPTTEKKEKIISTTTTTRRTTTLTSQKPSTARSLSNKINQNEARFIFNGIKWPGF